MSTNRSPLRGRREQQQQRNHTNNSNNMMMMDHTNHAEFDDDDDDIMDNNNYNSNVDNDDDDDEATTDQMYDVIPDPQAATVDLSKLRGVAEQRGIDDAMMNRSHQTDLENLAELVPDVRHKKSSSSSQQRPPQQQQQQRPSELATAVSSANRKDLAARTFVTGTYSNNKMHGSMEVQETSYYDLTTTAIAPHQQRHPNRNNHNNNNNKANTMSDHRMNDHGDDDDDSPSDIDAYSDGALQVRARGGSTPNNNNTNAMMKASAAEFMSAQQSISTATQTHEVLMPMYLPTFKPATGCTNASDFIVRCFVARLRSGITVVKHGRSRWAKSRLRILHVHPDGRSLSWKPAEGEPNSSKRPPKLDLSTCTEVRHAWSPDPTNPMYTGTASLRLKCEAANAHKSFALIFPTRTVDITAVTADQCKVLMEGFSALCFRLQVANLAKSKHARPMPEEDGVSTTASATLTNSSTPRGATAATTTAAATRP